MVWSIEHLKNYLFGKEFSIITDHRALLSILKEHRSNKTYNSRLSRWVDRLLPYQFKIEHLPGAKMGLVDYISRKPYKPAKSISKYDEEFLVATLSRIHTDAKLLQKNHNISANTLNNIYYENKFEVQNSSKKHTEQVLNIDFAKPKILTKDNMSIALQFHSSKSPLKQNSNFVSDPAKRVRLTTNNSALTTRMYRSTLPSFKANDSDSEHAPARMLNSK